MPAIGYDHPNQSHFTSRHFWEVGELERRRQLGWLGRFLDQHGVGRQPDAGPVAELLPVARRWPRRRCRSPRSTGPTSSASTCPASATRCSGRCTAPSAASARCRRATRRWARRGWWRPRWTRSARRCCPTRATPSRTHQLRHQRLRAQVGGVGLDARRQRAGPRGRASTPRGSWDSHSDQANTIGRDVQNALRHAAGLPARHRGARHRRPRPHPRLDRVRPPPAGERRRHRPRRGRRLVPDRHQGRRPDGRRVPGPRRHSISRATSRSPATSAASTARCWSSGTASTRRRSSRARRASRGRRSSRRSARGGRRAYRSQAMPSWSASRR